MRWLRGRRAAGTVRTGDCHSEYRKQTGPAATQSEEIVRECADDDAIRTLSDVNRALVRRPGKFGRLHRA
jgi:hypothetical protein